MRRFAFYFAVGLLAFGFSVIIYFLLFSKPNNKTLAVVNIKESPIVDETKKEIVEGQQIIEDKYEPDFLPLKPLIEKWIRGEEIKEVPISLKTLKESDESVSLLEYARPQLSDLNNDGVKELIIFSGCAGNGNCSCEIFIKKDKEYKQILVSNMIRDVNSKKSPTSKFNDLELRTWNTGFEYYIQIFKFNDKEYQAKKCWFETHQVNGQFLKKPKITFVKCGEYEYVK